MAYTLIVSGERFNFTKEQLESDPDNYFTTYFFGSFSEAREGTKELVIEKEPGLFKLIQAHLRGYDIFPIPDGCIPYMSKEVVLKNLLKEAEFYALGDLVKTIKDVQVANFSGPAQSKYKFRSVSLGETDVTRVYTWDLNEAEYHSVLSSGGARYWGWEGGHDILAMDGYKALVSWTDCLYSTYGSDYYCCAILILDE